MFPLPDELKPSEAMSQHKLSPPCLSGIVFTAPQKELTCVVVTLQKDIEVLSLLHRVTVFTAGFHVRSQPPESHCLVRGLLHQR